MILIFCAFGAEMAPLRARLSVESSLKANDLRGYYGRFGDTRVAVVESGIGVRRSRATAARALDTLHDIDLVVTTGVAGGLRDDLQLGAVVLADRVMTRHPDSFVPDTTLDISTDWLAAVSGALDAGHVDYARGPALTSRYAIATAEEKRRAHRESGAIVVDMESAMIAIEANNRKLPFVYLRTIMDTAAEEVVGAELADPDGNLRKLAAAKTLLTNPRRIAGVVRLVRNLRLASLSMAAAVDAMARHLG